MIVMVDGDNAPGANINGINRLESTDTVYIYYASDNKYFKRTEKQEAIRKMSKCSVDFTSIPAGSNAVDFAIAMDLRAIADNCPSEIIILVSDDKHFGMIMARAKDTTNSTSIYQVSDIEEAAKRYKMLESSSLQELHKYLSRSFGQEKGCEFYRKLDEFFAQKHLTKTVQTCSDEGGVKEESAKTGRLVEKLKTRLLPVGREVWKSLPGTVARSLTASFAALLRL